MNKSELIDRLILAAGAARNFAKRFYHAEVELPEKMTFTLHFGPSDRAPEVETIKFLGGRLIKPEELVHIPASKAGSLLWVDGKVPEWVNISLTGYSPTESEFELYFSSRLVLANEQELPPDVTMERGNKLVPFRIRGPGDDSWVKR